LNENTIVGRLRPADYDAAWRQTGGESVFILSAPNPLPRERGPLNGIPGGENLHKAPHLAFGRGPRQKAISYQLSFQRKPRLSRRQPAFQNL